MTIKQSILCWNYPFFMSLSNLNCKKNFELIPFRIARNAQRKIFESAQGEIMSLKTITATVGEGGANIPADVATIQYLLNCVPVSQGGPIKELKIDGFAGVMTTEAINRFQKFHSGSSESLLQSDDATFGELKKFDPLPFSTPVVAPNFTSSKASMDPSKMNKSIDGGSVSAIYVKKSIDGGGIKNLVGAVYVKRTIDGVKRD